MNRTPTLSYTQRLEQKVAQLEAALAEASAPTSKSQPTFAMGHETPGPNYDARPETRAEDEEILPLSNSISLFQLPGSIRASTFEREQVDQEVAAKKESLVNSAWRERAYERLADIPVSRDLCKIKFVRPSTQFRETVVKLGFLSVPSARRWQIMHF
jgi:hypothetical protein